jgi:hypothetical protein
MKLGLANRLVYVAYPLMLIEAAFFLYFEHYALFTLVFISIFTGIGARLLSRATVKSIEKVA